MKEDVYDYPNLSDEVLGVAAAPALPKASA
jgi:hypothetical protein